jgi:chemotaxis protein methyltransferase CheR
MQEQATREFSFSAADYEWIRQSMRRSTGIVLSEAKRDLIYNRLARRLRNLGLSTFTEYRSFLEANPKEEVEFVNALTTNVTSFFREEHHFQFLADLLGRKSRAGQGERRLRIWSAGCSTGEEPYSIAMTILETLGRQIEGWDVKILATDLDTNVLTIAEQGIYPADRAKELSQDRLRRFFMRGTGERARLVRVREEARALLTFRQLNLMEAWPMRRPFDVIFCRNVVIYFDRATQAQLFDRFAESLVPGGHLLLGHSESIGDAAGRFKTVGRTVHQKVS